MQIVKIVNLKETDKDDPSFIFGGPAEDVIYDNYGDNYPPSDYIKGPGDIFIDEKTYLDLVKDGCVNCQRSITVPMGDEIEWTRGKQPVCSGCSALPGVVEYLN